MPSSGHPSFSFKVLGANSATPLPGRFPSSFVLQYNQRLMLIDCGEGAQIKMSQFKVKRSKLDYIFISHLHGDHIFGLPGFFNSLSLNGRVDPITIYGPKGIRLFLETLRDVTGGRAGHDIIIHELDGSITHDLGIINGLKVSAFPLQHRVPTLGYRFDEEPRQPGLSTEALATYRITIDEIKLLKQGIPIKRDGQVIPIEAVTKAPLPLRSFAYCSDTVYDPSIIPHIEAVDLLYHEATYLHELADKARERMHSTSIEAAMIARDALVKELIIGHYSGRYKDLSVMTDEAKTVFSETQLALEGEEFEIG